MTARLPGLNPAELDPAQRAHYDDTWTWSSSLGLYLTACAIVKAFEVPVPPGSQPESSTP
jgi:hypothetical protein